MNHKDYVLAAKELNVKAGSNLKTVAIKGDDLKKSIQDLTPALTKFDFSLLSPPCLNVLDALNCEMPEAKTTKTKKKADVIPLERTKLQQGPAMIAAATDLIDVLNYDKEDIKKFKALDLAGMVTELQNMADVINEPYEEDGKTIQPDDKATDFKTETIQVFGANSITVNWNEGVKEVSPELAIADKAMPIKKKKAKTEKKKPELEFHKYADLFPETDEDTCNEIVKDMNENGFREDRPIILFAGKIADGRTRHKCAEIAGIKAAYTVFNGTEAELFKHVIALNLKRRHLTPAQRATLGAELLPEFEKAAKEKQKAGGKGKKTDTPVRATEEAAKVTGSTPGAVSTAKKIKKESPEKFEEMKKGKTTIAAAKRETQEKTAVDKFNDAGKILKAKLKMVQKSIHELVDAAELAEQKIEYMDSLDLIENAILTVLG